MFDCIKPISCQIFFGIFSLGFNFDNLFITSSNPIITCCFSYILTKIIIYVLVIVFYLPGHWFAKLIFKRIGLGHFIFIAFVISILLWGTLFICLSFLLDKQ